MKKMNRLLLVAFVSMWSVLAYSQAGSVTGTVTDSAGNPLQAVTIKVKGTKISALSTAKGSFTISLPSANATLELSSVGYANREVDVTAGNPVAVVLSSTSGQLNEVVVTALGIQRQKKSLGYSIQQVKGESLVESREVNLVNDLSGKVAGLQVVRGGSGPTGSSQIILRGNNSLTGLSQPLIVIDGIPMDNSTGRVGIGASNGFYNTTLDMGNGLSDINPEDIASISVLKGPAAAALYGSLGGNGVILITTKTGKKQPGLGITVTSSVGFESIFTNPDMQNEYAQGTNGRYDSSSGSSWGPKINGQVVTDWSGKQVTLQPYDNVHNFFNTGIVSNQNISFQQLINSTSIYASYNRFDDKSMIPGVKLTRNNITARTVSKFGNNENWTIDTKFQFINASFYNRPIEGEDYSIFGIIDNLPRTLDIRNFENPLDSSGKMFWWEKPSATARNPYWTAKYDLNNDTRNRYIMYASAKHNFTTWLMGEINGGADIYTTNSESKLYAGGATSATGSYSLGRQTYEQTNYSGMLTAHKDNVFGKLGGSVMAGGNLMHSQSSELDGSAGTLKVPNLFSVNNSAGNPTVQQASYQKKINSLYGSLELNYDGYLFLSGTARNDWSSALSPRNNSFFYPSVSLSYVFTDMINQMGGRLPSWFSFGKLRASYASAGSDLPPYELYNSYFINTDPNGNTTGQRNTTLFNDSVRSQLMKSYEAGAELRFFNNKIGLDVSVYKSDATNQLIHLPLDPLSGYSDEIINAADVRNKGIEITADARLLDNPRSLNWTLGVNFSHNKTTVPFIYPGVDQYHLPGGGFDNIQILAVAGQPYGEIYGTQLMRVTDAKDPNYGQLILSSIGLPQATTDISRLGNQQASALLGITNSFSYKGFGLLIQIDGRFGGKIFSQTLDNMERNGTAAITGGSRDSMIVQGVVLDGNGGY
ncbi:MAG: SusC/RagA family TonB-linked outer membrane protein, partial [Parafilimonas sp.]|nr:SusC/RagA family TonB-linked outer membrane protein [Parafilimonas sp.]